MESSPQINIEVLSHEVQALHFRLWSSHLKFIWHMKSSRYAAVSLFDHEWLGMDDNGDP
jgi:hypothetical protein